MAVTQNSAMTSPTDNEANSPEPIHEPRLWRDNGWTARVVKNNDDDGWAVEMIRDGEPEPALTGPWTMGRDKKNPKPFDTNAFNTLVKTAAEFVRRHEQQLHAQLHKQVFVTTARGRISVTLDIVPDEDEPHAFLAATDSDGQSLAQWRVRPDFKFSGPWPQPNRRAGRSRRRRSRRYTSPPACAAHPGSTGSP